MLNIMVIENQIKSTLTLTKPYANKVPEISLKTEWNPVKKSTEFFSKKQVADTGVSEVQLPDGFSFDIFAKTDIRILKFLSS